MIKFSTPGLRKLRSVKVMLVSFPSKEVKNNKFCCWKINLWETGPDDVRNFTAWGLIKNVEQFIQKRNVTKHKDIEKETNIQRETNDDKKRHRHSAVIVTYAQLYLATLDANK